MTKKRQAALLGLILAGAMAFHLYELDEKWYGIGDYNGATYGIMARNTLRYGFVDVRFGPSVQTGPIREGGLRYYLHHPPVFYWLLALSFRVTGGAAEWNARLVPILFSLLSLFFFFRLVRRLWGDRTACWSTFFLAFFPMNLYYGRIVLQESSITLGTVLMIGYYLDWRESRRPSDYWKLVGVFAVFGMLDWPAYYVPPLLALHGLVLDRGRRAPGRLRIALLPLFGVVLFGVFLGYSALLGAGQGGAGLLDAFVFRSALKTPFLDYTFGEFLRLEAWRGWRLFTPVAPLLALAWLTGFAAGRRDPGRDAWVWIFLLVGAIHVLLFEDAAWLHDFWMYPLGPGIALAAGIAVSRALGAPFAARRRLARNAAAVAVALLFVATATRETLLLHAQVGPRMYARAGERIHGMSGENDRVIVHWEDPVPLPVRRYFRQYGDRVYNKPFPTVAYYADRNIRWGLEDMDDFRALLAETDAPYRFFLTRIEYMRDGMGAEMRRTLLENFSPIVLFDLKGDEAAPGTAEAFLRGEEIGVRRGLILFERRAGSG